MTDREECGQFAPLLAELAAGAVYGNDRAVALQHVAVCGWCGREFIELVRTSDALLALAPATEPPPGFENSVLASLDRQERRPPDRRVFRGIRSRGRQAGTEGQSRLRIRLAAAAVVLALGAGGGAAVIWQQTEQDRQVAAQYRQTLEIANGSYLKAGRLTADLDTPGGGTVYLYQGNPSWLLISVSGAIDDRYTVTTVDGDGVRWKAGTCTVTGHSGIWAYQLNIQVSSLAEIQLEGKDGRYLVAKV